MKTARENISIDAEGKPCYQLHDYRGNVAVVVAASGKVLAHNRYYPYGEAITRFTGSHAAAQSNAKAVAARYRFGAKEHETMHGLNAYDFGPRLLSASLPVWDCPDRQQERYHPLSPYPYCAANPIKYVDPTGEKVFLYATGLPLVGDAVRSSSISSHIPIGYIRNSLSEGPTHTFIAVVSDGKTLIYSYGYEKITDTHFCAPLCRMDYESDRTIAAEGMANGNCKAIIPITPPNGLSESEFDQTVINTANSFGGNEGILYNLFPKSDKEGNCNSSTSTILLKSGVSPAQIEVIKAQIPGISEGFASTAKPWTADEQAKAVKSTPVSNAQKINGFWGGIVESEGKIEDTANKTFSAIKDFYAKIRNMLNF